MRSVLLLLAAGLLLAGCATPVSDQSASTTSSGQGIAVGEPAPGHGGALIRPSHAENTSAQIHLAGDESASGLVAGGEVTFKFNATNQGADATVRGSCESPWSFQLFDANGTEHQLQTASGTCSALSIDPFPARSSLEVNPTWDGTYAVGGHMQKAPVGHYAFQAVFTARRDAQAVVSAVVSVSLPITIVEPGQQ
jgi:hypothetical protein